MYNYCPHHDSNTHCLIIRSQRANKSENERKINK